MALVTTEAIVVKTVNFGEGHKIITFFTQKYGKLQIVVKGAYSLKNKFGASIEPMMLSQIVFYDRPHKDLQFLSQSDIIQSFSNIRQNFTLTSLGLYVVDLVNALTVERDKSQALFILLKQTLEHFEKNTSSKILIKYFEIKFFKIIGYGLQLKTCVKCGKNITYNRTLFSLDILRGGIICPSCKNINENIEITGETLKVLDVLSNIEIDKIDRLKISSKAYKELESVVELYRKKYLTYELQTLKFIKKIELSGLPQFP